ncbi:MAG: hypothetical protein N3C13_03475 [Aquificaceae bacterium]|nr:hypothetical protein [Aquificaceae bacterium]MCX8060240.1 hypothetical protein [Aquificaceae bacterium]MDW8097040.1 hypothetical protein [Aquificaceae bacterium]
MLPTLRAFFEITTRHTDLRWAKTRDDLVSRSIKALRAFREGKTLQEVRQSKELSFEIEESLESMHRFVKEHPEEVERLIGLLSLFVKSPAPCKIRLIYFAEAFLEDRRVSQAGAL